MIRLCEHPVYGKYFKLLKEGRSNATVKAMMKQDGLDPKVFVSNGLISRFWIWIPTVTGPLKMARRVREPSGGQFVRSSTGMLCRLAT